MKLQNQIKRTLSRAASIEYLINLLKDKTIPHRTEVAKLVCRDEPFFNPPKCSVQKSGIKSSEYEYMATIGGYLNRKNDLPPGHQILCMDITSFNLCPLEFYFLKMTDCMTAVMGNRQGYPLGVFAYLLNLSVASENIILGGKA